MYSVISLNSFLRVWSYLPHQCSSYSISDLKNHSVQGYIYFSLTFWSSLFQSTFDLCLHFFRFWFLHWIIFHVLSSWSHPRGYINWHVWLVLYSIYPDSFKLKKASVTFFFFLVIGSSHWFSQLFLVNSLNTLKLIFGFFN